MSVILVGPAVVLRAIAFAHTAGVGAIASWMCWPGWQLYVGCDRCRTDGAAAPCWGRAGCHTYLAGCGCRDCSAHQAEAQAA